MFNVINSPVFGTLKILNLINSWNFDSDETCKNLATLIATAPKLERVNLKSYRCTDYARCYHESYRHRAIRVEMKYATKNAQGVKQNGFVRIYRVHLKYPRTDEEN